MLLIVAVWAALIALWAAAPAARHALRRCAAGRSPSDLRPRTPTVPSPDA